MRDTAQTPFGRPVYHFCLSIRHEPFFSLLFFFLATLPAGGRYMRRRGGRGGADVGANRFSRFPGPVCCSARGCCLGTWLRESRITKSKLRVPLFLRGHRNPPRS